MEGTGVTFEEFFLDHYGDVVRSIGLAVGDRLRAEELVQEAFARALRHWRRVSELDRPVAWVYVVALNEARRSWSRERRASVGNGRVELAPDPAGGVAITVDVRAALEQLTERQRAAIVLRYLADLSIDDIADALGCAPGTVKATLHQARARLRIELEDDDDAS